MRSSARVLLTACHAVSVSAALNTVVPGQVKQTNEPCVCKDTWSFVGDLGTCGESNHGCPSAPCDPEFGAKRWCMVENPGCLTSEGGDDGYYPNTEGNADSFELQDDYMWAFCDDTTPVADPWPDCECKDTWSITDEWMFVLNPGFFYLSSSPETTCNLPQYGCVGVHTCDNYPRAWCEVKDAKCKQVDSYYVQDAPWAFCPFPLHSDIESGSDSSMETGHDSSHDSA